MVQCDVRTLVDGALRTLSHLCAASAAFAYEQVHLIRLTDDPALIIEIQGYETDEEHSTHTAARRWVAAVNNWGQGGQWAFHVCRDPQLLTTELQHLFGPALPAIRSR